MQVSAIAQTGLVQALNRFDASATRTAQAGNPTSDVDLASEVVEQVDAKASFSANLSVLKSYDEMVGQLLDMKV